MTPLSRIYAMPSMIEPVSDGAVQSAICGMLKRMSLTADEIASMIGRPREATDTLLRAMEAVGTIEMDPTPRLTKGQVLVSLWRLAHREAAE
jgi:DNA-binding IclR family transcriptional regulator